MYDVLYCSFRLKMPWRRYLEEHDLLDHYVWLQWFGMHQFEDINFKGSDPYYCKVGDGPDDHVPTKTYERWKLKVAEAGNRLMCRDQILMKFAKQGDQEAINRLKAQGVKVK